MKLNKSKLRQLTQSGEVAATPVSLKRKKVDEGSSKWAEEVPSRPPIQDVVPLVRAVPPVIMVDMDPALLADLSVATVNQSSHVAMDRAKGAISSRDMDDYAAAYTKDVQYLLVHSLMRVCLLVSFPFMDFLTSFVFNFHVFIGSE